MCLLRARQTRGSRARGRDISTDGTIDVLQCLVAASLALGESHRLPTHRFKAVPSPQLPDVMHPERE